MIDMTVTWSDIEKELQACPCPDETNEVIVFGAGLLGQSEAPCLRTTLSVCAFCDNDNRKHNTRISELPCISPQEAVQYKRPFILISTIKNYSVIEEQLTKIHIPFCSVDAYVLHKYWNQFSEVYRMLDEDSRGVYAGMLLSRMKGERKRLPALCEEHQYFALPQFRFCGIQEVFVDCGAYTGENTQTFINNQAGLFKKIYAFEANPAAFAAMRRRLAREKDVWLFKEEQIVCERNFVSNEDGVKIPFHVTRENPTNSFVKEGDSDVEWIETVSLDRYFERKGEECITFLKADIEGAEWDMLHGGEQIIRRSRPKMAISIYHNIYDFFRIPLYLKELVPSYHFAVRQHWDSFEETILYCYSE